MPSLTLTATSTALGDGAIEVILDSVTYLTQSDLWSNKIFKIGDRVVSLMPGLGTAGEWGTVAEINRREPEKFTAYDDLIVVWDSGKRDCLYFNQIGKKA